MSWRPVVAIFKVGWLLIALSLSALPQNSSSLVGVPLHHLGLLLYFGPPRLLPAICHSLVRKHSTVNVSCCVELAQR